MKNLASVSLLVLAVPACAPMGLGEDASPPPAATAQPGGKAEARPPAPVRQQAARPAPQVKGLRPEPRPQAGPETAALPGTAPKLVGLSESETVDLLGRPAEETDTPPGKIWLYKAGGCQLSVHLFPDMEKGGFYTLDYTADGARDACLGKVAGEARKRGGMVITGQVKQG